MLMLTSRATDRPVQLHTASGWPGPLVFASLPGHGRRQSELRAIERDALVVECLDPPPSLPWLVAATLSGLPHLLAEDGPLLLADSPLGAAEARDRLRTALAAPRGVRAAADRILLGAEVLSHPLAPALLREIRDRALPPAAALALVAAVLGAPA
jgi:hypothetical protein